MAVKYEWSIQLKKFLPCQLHNLAWLSLGPEQGHHFKISVTHAGSLSGQPLEHKRHYQQFLLWGNYSFSEDIISQQSKGMPDSNPLQNPLSSEWWRN